MCGILGVVRLDGAVDLDALEHGRDSLRHRGPDGGALWTTRVEHAGHSLAVALAHRRLSILDLTARADQPLLMEVDRRTRAAEPRESGDAPYALCYNGEIYNFVELRDELRALGHQFRSSGDTEVLLRAYTQWGEECLTRLNGMFSFAIWDRQRGRLFCARDRFGEKPFHYVFDDRRGMFAFASEIKALIGSGLSRAELDERAVFRYFRFGEQAGAEQTIWRGVRRLPAAHSLTLRVADGRLAVDIRRYWDVDLHQRTALSIGDASDRFAALFADSVKIRLRSDVPIGTSLSGGLDSTSVICEVQRLGAAAGQRAFTARMDDPALDEGKYVEAVLRQTGIPGFSVRPSPQRLLAEFDRLFFHQEEPFPSTSLFASYLVHGLARENGVTVMLDGQGADEYLAGYAHYPALLLTDLVRRGRARTWWRERRALRARVGIDPVPPRAALVHAARAVRGVDRAQPVDRIQDVAFLSRPFRDRWQAEQPRMLVLGRDGLRARLYADLMQGHLQELLRYTDRNAMALSIEVRLPFLDHRLVELCFALPTSFLFRDGTSKWIMRRAMRGTVPDAILDRTDKVGFATPWESWWQGDISRELEDRLRDSEATLPDVVAPGATPGGTPAALGVMAIATALTQMRAIRPRQAAVA